MYRNEKLQRKRIKRKLSEVSFDVEVLRNFLDEPCLGDLDYWEEVVMDCEEARTLVIDALELAKQTVQAIKDGVDAPEVTPGPEQVANPFAAKSAVPEKKDEKASEAKPKTAK